MGDLGQLPHVIQIVAADIDVEKNGIAVPILFTDQVVELFPDGSQSFRQSLFDIYRIYGNIESGNSCIREFVNDVDTKQAGIRWKINPEILLCGVVGDALNQVGPQ